MQSATDARAIVFAREKVPPFRDTARLRERPQKHTRAHLVALGRGLNVNPAPAQQHLVRVGVGELETVQRTHFHEGSPTTPKEVLPGGMEERHA